MNPLVSIIIPCYNTERWIAQAIDSALSQTYSWIEVIVVDNGSTDRSLEIIASYGNKIKWETCLEQGGGAARNRGFQLCQGQYVQWLDADDYLQATKVESQMNVVLKHQDAVIYGPWINRIETAKTMRFGPCNLTKEVSDPLAAQLEGLLAPTIAFLTPRAVLESVGGWDETLSADQDGDLFMRFMLRGIPFVHAPGGAAVWRHHPSPHRVSGSRSLAAFRSRYNVCCRVIDELRYHHRLEQYARLLAWRLDGLAQLAVLDYPDFAEECLIKASEIYPNYQPRGSITYKLLRRIFGLKGSEQIRLMQRKFKQHISPNAETIPGWLTSKRLTEV
jgi:glycosyltransferase involved in cell wall biosynthesis